MAKLNIANKTTGDVLTADEFNQIVKAINDVPDNSTELSTLKSDVSTLQKGKVDTVPGKELSTNDYTNEDKERLQSVAAFNPDAIYDALSEKLSAEQVYSKEKINAMIEEARISLNLTEEQLAGLNVNLTPLQNELAEINLFSLKGKKLVALGDSSTGVGGTMTDIKTGSWVANVTAKLKLSNLSRNIAAGSATWRDRYDGSYSDNYAVNEGQNTISSQVYRLIKYCIEKMGTPSEFIPDFIFIQSGGNDLPNNSYPYPKWDTFMGNFDTVMYNTSLSDLDYNPINISTSDGQNLHVKLKTFRGTLFGAMRWAIETLLTHFPNATIFIGSPLQRGHEKNRNIFELRDGMRRMAEFYNCPFVDCTAMSGMTWFSENRKTNGWSDNWYTYDQTHKNGIGNELVGNFISGQIKRLYFDKPQIVATKRELRQFTVATSFASGSDMTQGDIIPLGNSSVLEGSSLVVEILAKSGYEIDDVIVDGVSNGAVSSYVFSNISKDSTLQAKFKVRATPLNPPALNSITINNGATTTDVLNADVRFHVSGGTPTHYKLALSEPGLESIAWIAYSSNVIYTLATGLNTIYAKVKNMDGESLIKFASITYMPTSISTWISKVVFGYSYPLGYDAGFTKIASNLDNKIGVAQILYDTSGNNIGNITVMVRGTSAAGGQGNQTGDESGLFPDEYLKYNSQWNSAYMSDDAPVKFNISIDPGIYKFRVFGNTKTVIADLSKCLYTIGGVTKIPLVTPTDNFTNFLCEFDITVSGAIELTLVGSSVGAKTVPINVLEIEKQS